MQYEALAEQLVHAGRVLHDLGMVPATSGNFSARINDNEFAATVSGKHKGRLSSDDIMRVDNRGKSLDGKVPSAEVGLHARIYQRFPETGAILHVHSIFSTLLSRVVEDNVVLENYELLKAFPGIKTHEVRVTVPVFANDQDIDRLAGQVDEFFSRHDTIPAYLIRSHGLYTWGKTVHDALHYVEALEFLFRCELTLQGVIKP